MTIWRYSDDPHEIQPSWVTPAECIFCHTLMNTKSVDLWEEEHRQIVTCPSCGWWSIRGLGYTYPGLGGRPSNHWRRDLDVHGAVGALKRLDLSDIEVPISEVRSFLRARYEQRLSIHPRLFEETVASVFKSLGFSAKTTGYSGDGGIDVVLDGPNGTTIGVQVKRWKSTIQVFQIREFLGALALTGHTRGVFVTTSSYSKGAVAGAKLAESKGTPIQLINAEEFYDALGIAQLREPVAPEEGEYLARCQFLWHYEISIARGHPRTDQFYSDLLGELRTGHHPLTWNLISQVAERNHICPNHEVSAPGLRALRADGPV
ncbi:MAG TPA: restriction endonuclease [Thermoanaerobaculia bacterium]|nr:restriction endonuclease [Thermoanaerobaculia bacterium]